MAFPNRPPRPQSSPTQLARLTPSPRTHTLVALLLGVQGPREIVKKDRTKTLLATLYIADESLPTGMEAVIWGRQALQAANLRIMDVVHVQQVFCENDSFRGAVIKFRGDASVAPVSRGFGGIVQRLLQWRGSAYGELLGFAERGRLRSREWGDGMASSPSGEACSLRGVVTHGGVREVDFVYVTSIRIRVPRDKYDEVCAIRALCRKICSGCSKRLSGDACACGAGSWKWGFGWLVIGLRDGSGEFSATVEGEVVGRLLFGVSVEKMVQEDDVARDCCRVLEALVRDGGCFRVVVQGRGDGRLRLLQLFV